MKFQCRFLEKSIQKYCFILLIISLFIYKQSHAETICAANTQQEQQAIAAYIYLAATSNPQDFLIPLEKGKFNFPELKVLRDSIMKFDEFIPLKFGDNVFIINKSMKYENIIIKNDPSSIGYQSPQPSTFIIRSKNEVILIFSGTGPVNITIISIDKCFNSTLQFNSLALKNLSGFDRYGMLENPICRIVISDNNKIKIYEGGVRWYYDDFTREKMLCRLRHG